MYQLLFCLIGSQKERKQAQKEKVCGVVCVCACACVCACLHSCMCSRRGWEQGGLLVELWCRQPCVWLVTAIVWPVSLNRSCHLIHIMSHWFEKCRAWSLGLPPSHNRLPNVSLSVPVSLCFPSSSFSLPVPAYLWWLPSLWLAVTALAGRWRSLSRCWSDFVWCAVNFFIHYWPAVKDLIFVVMFECMLEYFNVSMVHFDVDNRIFFLLAYIIYAYGVHQFTISSEGLL